jgi:hypothetical protein
MNNFIYTLFVPPSGGTFLLLGGKAKNATPQGSKTVNDYEASIPARKRRVPLMRYSPVAGTGL